MTVTKCFNLATDQLYPPLVPLLKSVGLDVDEIYRLEEIVILRLKTFFNTLLNASLLLSHLISSN